MEMVNFGPWRLENDVGMGNGPSYKAILKNNP